MSFKPAAAHFVRVPAKSAKKPKAAKAKASKKATTVKKFGRMGTAGKAEGDAPVLAYMAQLPADQRAIAEKVDEIIAKNVPGVRRAMKWSTPFYGLEGRGWFASFGAFKAHTAVNFFRGTDLKPQPPGGEGKGMRHVRYETVKDLEAGTKQLVGWVKQAAAMPGWGKG